jgi:hypothetical protein
LGLSLQALDALPCCSCSCGCGSDSLTQGSYVRTLHWGNSSNKSATGAVFDYSSRLCETVDRCYDGWDFVWGSLPLIKVLASVPASEECGWVGSWVLAMILFGS